MPTPSSLIRTKTNISPSLNENTPRSISKIPIRTHSTSQSRSRSPTTKAIHRLDHFPFLCPELSSIDIILDIYNNLQQLHRKYLYQ